jgi:alkylation response protein AidB-like acyl-CoA dehydrogenase
LQYLGAYGGLEWDLFPQCWFCDYISTAGSFSTTLEHIQVERCQSLYTEQEKNKKQNTFLELASQRLNCVGPGAGSDANSGRNESRFIRDGTHYKITGQKM